MPSYAYESKDGTEVEVIDCPFSKAPKRIRRRGKWLYFAVQAVYACHKSGMGTNKRGKSCYPYYSDAMAINPEQIPECQQVFEQAGLGPQQFDKDGCIEVTSRQHRKRLMKARGFVDRNSYNGY
jgi:hypothetical protein